MTDFKGRKTGLFKPVWLADRFPDGFWEGKEERHPDDQERVYGKNVPEKCPARTTPPL
jgi:hypothetical protein